MAPYLSVNIVRGSAGGKCAETENLCARAPARKTSGVKIRDAGKIPRFDSASFYVRLYRKKNYRRERRSYDFGHDKTRGYVLCARFYIYTFYIYKIPRLSSAVAISPFTFIILQWYFLELGSLRDNRGQVRICLSQRRRTAVRGRSYLRCKSPPVDIHSISNNPTLNWNCQRRTCEFVALF